jgi:hypothetical protein
MSRKIVIDEASGELSGRWVKKRWKAGVIPALMAGGRTLDEAMQEAAEQGGCLDIERGNNLVIAKGEIATVLADELDYFAIGTGNSTPLVSNTTLDTEVFRKVWSLTPSVVGNTVQATVFMLSSECAYAIEEAGVFGFGATVAIDSTPIFSRFLVSEDNSSGDYDLTFEYNVEVQ